MGNRIKVIPVNQVFNPILISFKSLLHVKVKISVLPHAADGEISNNRYYFSWNHEGPVPFEILSWDLRLCDLGGINIPWPTGHEAHESEK